jgi:hypothetical protein
LAKHANISPGGLRVLVLEKAKDHLPEADEIAAYDIILFSKSRFEQEAKDGTDEKVMRFLINFIVQKLILCRGEVLQM